MNGDGIGRKKRSLFLVSGCEIISEVASDDDVYGNDSVDRKKAIVVPVRR